jgi:hypothetical protein
VCGLDSPSGICCGCSGWLSGKMDARILFLFARMPHRARAERRDARTFGDESGPAIAVVRIITIITIITIVRRCCRRLRAWIAGGQWHPAPSLLHSRRYGLTCADFRG